MFYFAYGSNTITDTIKKICPGFKIVGNAKLKNHRLGFTRYSEKWEGGVADIIPSQGFTVWGVLYDIDEPGFNALDKKEGVGFAYERIEITVSQSQNDEPVRTISYSVIDKTFPEIKPSPLYIETIIRGANEHKLPSRYIAFLHYIASLSKDHFREGLLIYGTRSRKESRGSVIIKVTDEYYRSQKLRKFSAMIFNQFPCLVETFVDTEMEQGYCQIDQNVRQAFGIEGLEHYGYSVTVERAAGKIESFMLIRPRYLILPVRRPSWMDSEKNICVLHPNNFKLLGIEEGEYLRIISVVKTDRGYATRSVSLRAYSGSATEVNRDGVTLNYPQTKEFYLDLDARQELGIDVENPVYIVADVKKQFLGRSIYYSTTILLAIVALSEIVQSILDRIGIRGWGLGVTIILAVVITVLMSILDIRAKIQYLGTHSVILTALI